MDTEIAAKFLNFISRCNNFVKIRLKLMHLLQYLNGSTIKTTTAYARRFKIVYSKPLMQ